MFRDCITNPIDPIPVQYVTKLNRLDYEPDYSLTCLGIAMLRKRMEHYEGIGGGYYNGISESTCVDNLLLSEQLAKKDYPKFYYYTYSEPSDPDRTVEKLKEHDFEIKESIGALLKNRTDLNCVAAFNKDKNIAAVFINSKDIRFYHMIISFISLLFPALFEDKPLEDRDLEIIKTLSKTSKDAFIKQIQENVQQYAAEFKRMMLVDLLAVIHTKKINEARETVDLARNELKKVESVYAARVESLRNAIITYEGTLATEHSDKAEEDLVDYLANNKEIHNVSILGSTITFTVATTLVNYNPDAWATFAKRGYIYDGKYTYNGRHTINMLKPFKDEDNRKLFLNSIFSEDPEFTVKIAGNYSLDLDRCVSSTSGAYNYINADPIYKDYMPNPHLKFFECLGGYKYKIADALRSKNYIGAIAMCIASAGSVDLDETEQTFRPFIGYLMSSTDKVLQNRNGEDVTPAEALEYLKEKNK